MFPVFDPVDIQGDGIFSTIGLIFFGILLIGLRARANHFGGDVSLIVFNWSVGIGWGK